MRCDRCGKETIVSTGSYFNTQQICSGPGSCEERERAHPLFPEAQRRDNEAVRRDDYNFPGFGLPDDLRT